MLNVGQSSMVSLISIDPGGVHVGVCFVQLREDGKHSVQCFEASLDEFLAIMHTTPADNFNTIIYEGFRVRDLPALVGDRPATVELIGAIRLMWAFGHGNLVEQLPSCKASWPDHELMRVLGWKPHNRHARDALRHLMHYLARTEKHSIIEQLKTANLYG